MPKLVGERLYKPKVTYHVVPKHQKEPINGIELAFNKMVKKILDIISFEKVWADFHLYQFFKHTSETMIEVKALFDEEVYLHG